MGHVQLRVSGSHCSHHLSPYLFMAKQQLLVNIDGKRNSSSSCNRLCVSQLHCCDTIQHQPVLNTTNLWHAAAASMRAMQEWTHVPCCNVLGQGNGKHKKKVEPQQGLELDHDCVECTLNHCVYSDIQATCFVLKKSDMTSARKTPCN